MPPKDVRQAVLGEGISVDDQGDSFYITLETPVGDVTLALNDEPAEALPLIPLSASAAPRRKPMKRRVARGPRTLHVVDVVGAVASSGVIWTTPLRRLSSISATWM